MQQTIFIADLIACSTRFGYHYVHHQELESIIQVVLWFSSCRDSVDLRVMCPHHTDNLKTNAPNTTGSNHLYNTLELLMMGIMVPETCWASNKMCNKKHLLYLVGILFPHINDDAWSKSLHISLILFQTYSCSLIWHNKSMVEVNMRQIERKPTGILGSWQ